MVAIIISLAVVWVILFAGWGNLHEIVPPGAMTQDEYTIQYMVVGLVVCLLGAICVKMWFSIADQADGTSILTGKYRGLMASSLVAGIAGAGYLMFLGAGDAGSNYCFTVLAGWLVYLIAALIGTPGPGRKYLPFG